MISEGLKEKDSDEASDAEVEKTKGIDEGYDKFILELQKDPKEFLKKEFK
jgi:hypothetical protein